MLYTANYSKNTQTIICPQNILRSLKCIQRKAMWFNIHDGTNEMRRSGYREIIPNVSLYLAMKIMSFRVRFNSYHT